MKQVTVSETGQGGDEDALRKIEKCRPDGIMYLTPSDSLHALRRGSDEIAQVDA